MLSSPIPLIHCPFLPLTQPPSLPATLLTTSSHMFLPSRGHHWDHRCSSATTLQLPGSHTSTICSRAHHGHLPACPFPAYRPLSNLMTCVKQRQQETCPTQHSHPSVGSRFPFLLPCILLIPTLLTPLPSTHKGHIGIHSICPLLHTAQKASLQMPTRSSLQLLRHLPRHHPHPKLLHP